MLKELIQDPAACLSRNTEQAFLLLVSTAKPCCALMFEAFEGHLSSYTREQCFLCGATSHHENVPSGEGLAAHEALSPVSQGSFQIGSVETLTKVNLLFGILHTERCGAESSKSDQRSRKSDLSRKD